MLATLIAFKSRIGEQTWAEECNRCTKIKLIIANTSDIKSLKPTYIPILYKTILYANWVKPNIRNEDRVFKDLGSLLEQ